ncbi:UNKNOWN [Stylonychia lemnae]|uniref:Uncharacterized protein n=1 Tax=Stylonychia lemnae TaxID=5949 RepID=A0A078A543_STYLE|nr:UNKNOWN [Stylonychia lemnae]|eukprot:CDW76700.1 UNKNOWN [Stylonychia lemnae]
MIFDNNNSEYKQPLLEDQMNDQQQQLSKTSDNTIQGDYLWIFDKYKEIDYSKIESRIKKIPLNVQKENESEVTLVQYIILPHRNLILAHFKQYQRDRFLDFIDLESLQKVKTIQFQQNQPNDQIFHQLFNNVDYLFYKLDESVYLQKLDDFSQENDNHLIEFKFNKDDTLFSVNIFDEFNVLVHFGYNIILYRL